MKQSARQRTWKKIILDQKQTESIFPFSKIRREQGPVAGDPAQQEMPAERTISEKGKHGESAGTGTGDR